ncbi:MAG: hypothetical protein ABH952_08260 [Candidatus Omnitrophota bacterium]
MKKINNLLNKKSLIGIMLTLITFYGCTGMFMSGIRFNVDKYYPKFIGVKLIPLKYPSSIKKNVNDFYIAVPDDAPEYDYAIANVPEGTVITISHVIREYTVENEINDFVMGQIDVPGYKGLVILGLCDGRKNWAIDRCIDLTKYKILSKPNKTNQIK